MAFVQDRHCFTGRFSASQAGFEDWGASYYSKHGQVMCGPHFAVTVPSHGVQVQPWTDIRLAAMELERREFIHHCMKQACNHIHTVDRRDKKNAAVKKVYNAQVASSSLLGN